MFTNYNNKNMIKNSNKHISETVVDTECEEKIRNIEDYAKNYLQGKYGAIPAIKELDMFKG